MNQEPALAPPGTPLREAIRMPVPPRPRGPRERAAGEFNWTRGRIAAFRRHARLLVEAVVPLNRQHNLLRSIEEAADVILTYAERRRAELYARAADQANASPSTPDGA